MNTKWISSLDFDSKLNAAFNVFVDGSIVYSASFFDYFNECLFTLNYENGKYLKSNCWRKNLIQFQSTSSTIASRIQMGLSVDFITALKSSLMVLLS
mmetsp:Transcript_1689/g.2118  ORF Transcript_1689/g.2118 Transcript_1689/m.2118 type:complete len:97 (-) Transcript_1689:172-462(-)